MNNTIAGLKKILPLAEKRKVNLCIEPLNTHVDVEMKGHPGYQCDHVEWAVEYRWTLACTSELRPG